MSIYNINEEEFFVKLPNNTVWSLEEDGISLKKELQYPFTLSVLYQLYENTTPIGNTFFSIGELIINCGYKREKDTNKKFRALLKKLEEKEIITNCSVSLEEAKINDLIKCRLNLELKSNFFIVYHKQFKTVFESAYSTPIKNNVFTFLCYILSRIKTCSSEEENNIQWCYFSNEKAMIDLGISEDTIVNCRAISKNLGLIYTDNVGYVKVNNKNCSNVYALTEKGLEFGLRQSYEFYDNEYCTDFKPREDIKKKLFKDVN